MSQAALENQVGEGARTRQAIAPPSLQGENSLDTAGVGQCRPTGILVIEDERLMLKAMEQGLRKWGFAVWAAPDGGEGVDLYRRFRAQIDVVLSDVQMPVLDGPKTLDALREINPFVRCCFMTGDTRQSTLASLLRRGALRVFTKPFPSVAQVAEELRELATSSHDFTAGLKVAGDETAGLGSTAAAIQPEEKPAAGGCFGWIFSPLLRSVGNVRLLWDRTRTQPPGALPPT